MWERKRGKNSTTDSEVPCRWVRGAWNSCWLFVVVVFLFVLTDSVHFVVSCVLLKGHLWLSTWEISMIITFIVQSAFFSCNHYLLILFTPLFTPLFHEVHVIDTRLKFVTIKAFYRLFFMLSIPSFMISLWAHLNDVYLCFRNLLVPCESLVKVG